MSDCTRSNAQPDLGNPPGPGRRLGRRTLLLSLGAVCAPGLAASAGTEPPARKLPVPAGGSLAFRILRNGSEIGRHVVTFRQDGDTLRVDVAVDIVVKFGPIPVYRYVHRASEFWRDGVLIAADGKTNDDGKARSMTARLGPEGLVVEGTLGGRYVAPPGTLVANHWNRDELNGPMINPQGGKLLRPLVTRGPEEPVALASGGKLPARRFGLSGDVTLDLWYDRSDTWAATRFIPEDGSEVLYERI